jgi:hypothetical protein
LFWSAPQDCPKTSGAQTATAAGTCESEASKSGKDWPRGIVGAQASGGGGGRPILSPTAEGVDLEVEEADLDTKGMNREGLAEGSSSERRQQHGKRRGGIP